jgi:hypothetical protein
VIPDNPAPTIITSASGILIINELVSLKKFYSFSLFLFKIFCIV